MAQFQSRYDADLARQIEQRLLEAVDEKLKEQAKGKGGDLPVFIGEKIRNTKNIDLTPLKEVELDDEVNNFFKESKILEQLGEYITSRSFDNREASAYRMLGQRLKGDIKRIKNSFRDGEQKEMVGTLEEWFDTYFKNTIKEVNKTSRKGSNKLDKIEYNKVFDSYVNIVNELKDAQSITAEMQVRLFEKINTDIANDVQAQAQQIKEQNMRNAKKAESIIKQSRSFDKVSKIDTSKIYYGQSDLEGLDQNYIDQIEKAAAKNVDQTKKAMSLSKNGGRAVSRKNANKLLRLINGASLDKALVFDFETLGKGSKISPFQVSSTYRNKNGEMITQNAFIKLAEESRGQVEEAILKLQSSFNNGGQLQLTKDEIRYLSQLRDMAVSIADNGKKKLEYSPAERSNAYGLADSLFGDLEKIKTAYTALTGRIQNQDERGFTDGNKNTIASNVLDVKDALEKVIINPMLNIEKEMGKGAFLAGQNIEGFDIPLIRKLLQGMKETQGAQEILSSIAKGQYFDTMQAATLLQSIGPKLLSYSQEALAKYYKIAENGNRHNSEADVKELFKIMDEMVAFGNKKITSGDPFSTNFLKVNQGGLLQAVRNVTRYQDKYAQSFRSPAGQTGDIDINNIASIGGYYKLLGQFTSGKGENQKYIQKIQDIVTNETSLLVANSERELQSLIESGFSVASTDSPNDLDLDNYILDSIINKMFVSSGRSGAYNAINFYNDSNIRQKVQDKYDWLWEYLGFTKGGSQNIGNIQYRINQLKAKGFSTPLTPNAKSIYNDIFQNSQGRDIYQIRQSMLEVAGKYSDLGHFGSPVIGEYKSLLSKMREWQTDPMSQKDYNIFEAQGSYDDIYGFSEALYNIIQSYYTYFNSNIPIAQTLLDQLSPEKIQDIKESVSTGKFDNTFRTFKNKISTQASADKPVGNIGSLHSLLTDKTSYMKGLLQNLGITDTSEFSGRVLLSERRGGIESLLKNLSRNSGKLGMGLSYAIDETGENLQLIFDSPFGGQTFTENIPIPNAYGLVNINGQPKASGLVPQIGEGGKVVLSTPFENAIKELASDFAYASKNDDSYLSQLIYGSKAYQASDISGIRKYIRRVIKNNFERAPSASTLSESAKRDLSNDSKIDYKSSGFILNKASQINSEGFFKSLAKDVLHAYSPKEGISNYDELTYYQDNIDAIASSQLYMSLLMHMMEDYNSTQGLKEQAEKFFNEQGGSDFLKQKIPNLRGDLSLTYGDLISQQGALDAMFSFSRLPFQISSTKEEGLQDFQLNLASSSKYSPFGGFNYITKRSADQTLNTLKIKELGDKGAYENVTFENRLGSTLIENFENSSQALQQNGGALNRFVRVGQTTDEIISQIQGKAQAATNAVSSDLMLVSEELGAAIGSVWGEQQIEISNFTEEGLDFIRDSGLRGILSKLNEEGAGSTTGFTSIASNGSEVPYIEIDKDIDIGDNAILRKGQRITGATLTKDGGYRFLIEAERAMEYGTKGLLGHNQRLSFSPIAANMFSNILGKSGYDPSSGIQILLDEGSRLTPYSEGGLDPKNIVNWLQGRLSYIINEAFSNGKAKGRTEEDISKEISKVIEQSPYGKLVSFKDGKLYSKNPEALTRISSQFLDADGSPIFQGRSKKLREQQALNFITTDLENLAKELLPEGHQGLSGSGLGIMDLSLGFQNEYIRHGGFGYDHNPKTQGVKITPRARQNITRYWQALQNAGVDYTISKQVGDDYFWDQQATLLKEKQAQKLRQSYQIATESQQVQQVLKILANTKGALKKTGVLHGGKSLDYDKDYGDAQYANLLELASNGGIYENGQIINPSDTLVGKLFDQGIQNLVIDLKSFGIDPITLQGESGQNIAQDLSQLFIPMETFGGSGPYLSSEIEKLLKTLRPTKGEQINAQDVEQAYQDFYRAYNEAVNNKEGYGYQRGNNFRTGYSAYDKITGYTTSDTRVTAISKEKMMKMLDPGESLIGQKNLQYLAQYLGLQSFNQESSEVAQYLLENPEKYVPSMAFRNPLSQAIGLLPTKTKVVEGYNNNVMGISPDLQWAFNADFDGDDSALLFPFMTHDFKDYEDFKGYMSEQKEIFKYEQTVSDFYDLIMKGAKKPSASPKEKNSEAVEALMSGNKSWYLAAINTRYAKRFTGLASNFNTAFKTISDQALGSNFGGSLIGDALMELVEQESINAKNQATRDTGSSGGRTSQYGFKSIQEFLETIKNGPDYPNKAIQEDVESARQNWYENIVSQLFGLKSISPDSIPRQFGAAIARVAAGTKIGDKSFSDFLNNSQDKDIDDFIEKTKGKLNEGTITGEEYSQLITALKFSKKWDSATAEQVIAPETLARILSSSDSILSEQGLKTFADNMWDALYVTGNRVAKVGNLDPFLQAALTGIMDPTSAISNKVDAYEDVRLVDYGHKYQQRVGDKWEDIQDIISATRLGNLLHKNKFEDSSSSLAATKDKLMASRYGDDFDQAVQELQKEYADYRKTHATEPKGFEKARKGLASTISGTLGHRFLENWFGNKNNWNLFEDESGKATFFDSPEAAADYINKKIQSFSYSPDKKIEEQYVDINAIRSQAQSFYKILTEQMGFGTSILQEKALAAPYYVGRQKFNIGATLDNLLASNEGGQYRFALADYKFGNVEDYQDASHRIQLWMQEYLLKRQLEEEMTRNDGDTPLATSIQEKLKEKFGEDQVQVAFEQLMRQLSKGELGLYNIFSTTGTKESEGPSQFVTVQKHKNAPISSNNITNFERFLNEALPKVNSPRFFDDASILSQLVLSGNLAGSSMSTYEINGDAIEEIDDLSKLVERGIIKNAKKKRGGSNSEKAQKKTEKQLKAAKGTLIEDAQAVQDIKNQLFEQYVDINGKLSWRVSDRVQELRQYEMPGTDDIYSAVQYLDENGNKQYIAFKPEDKEGFPFSNFTQIDAASYRRQGHSNFLSNSARNKNAELKYRQSHAQERYDNFLQGLRNRTSQTNQDAPTGFEQIDSGRIGPAGEALLIDSAKTQVLAAAFKQYQEAISQADQALISLGEKQKAVGQNTAEYKSLQERITALKEYREANIKAHNVLTNGRNNSVFLTALPMKTIDENGNLVNQGLPAYFKETGITKEGYKVSFTNSGKQGEVNKIVSSYKASQAQTITEAYEELQSFILDNYNGKYSADYLKGLAQIQGRITEFSGKMTEKQINDALGEKFSANNVINNVNSALGAREVNAQIEEANSLKAMLESVKKVKDEQNGIINGPGDEQAKAQAAARSKTLAELENSYATRLAALESKIAERTGDKIYSAPGYNTSTPQGFISNMEATIRGQQEARAAIGLVSTEMKPKDFGDFIQNYKALMDASLEFEKAQKFYQGASKTSTKEAYASQMKIAKNRADMAKIALKKYGELDLNNEMIGDYKLTPYQVEQISKTQGAFGAKVAALNANPNAFKEEGIVGRFTRGLVNQTFRIAEMQTVYAVFGKIVSMFTTLIGNAEALNKKMVDLRIATGYTKDETRSLLKEYNNIAFSLGATTQEMAEAANDWLRAGYEGPEAAELSAASIKLSKLGQLEAADATTYLISTLKGWKLGASEVTGVVDKLTAVDMAAAISAGDLALAMSRANNSARIAGSGMDDFIGYVTTVADVTQKSAESVGESFKTIYSRFGNVKAGKFEASLKEQASENFDNSNYEGLNEIENVLKNVGINLRTGPNSWRNIDDVLSEIGDSWKSWSQTTQNAVSTAIAGTRQRENVISLFENWDQTQKFKAIAENSSGTSDEKMEVYTSEIEAAKARLTAAAEAWSQGELVQNAITEFYNVLTALTKSIKPLIMVAGAIALLNLPKALGLISKLVAGFMKLSGGFSSIFDGIIGKSNWSGILSPMKDAFNSQTIRNQSIIYAAELNKVTAALSGDKAAILKRTGATMMATDEETRNITLAILREEIEGQNNSAKQQQTQAIQEQTQAERQEAQASQEAAQAKIKKVQQPVYDDLGQMIGYEEVEVREEAMAAKQQEIMATEEESQAIVSEAQVTQQQTAAGKMNLTETQQKNILTMLANQEADQGIAVQAQGILADQNQTITEEQVTDLLRQYVQTLMKKISSGEKLSAEETNALLTTLGGPSNKNGSRLSKFFSGKVMQTINSVGLMAGSTLSMFGATSVSNAARDKAIADGKNEAEASEIAMKESMKSSMLMMGTTSLLSMVPYVGGILSAVAGGVFLGISSKEAKKQAERRQRLETAEEDQKTSKEKYEKTIGLDALAKRWDELNRHVDFRGQNLDLSEEEYQEYKDASNELAGVFPQLISYTDEAGNKFLKMSSAAGEASNSMESTIDNLQKLAKAQYAADNADPELIKKNYNDMINDSFGGDKYLLDMAKSMKLGLTPRSWTYQRNGAAGGKFSPYHGTEYYYIYDEETGNVNYYTADVSIRNQDADKSEWKLKATYTESELLDKLAAYETKQQEIVEQILDAIISGKVTMKATLSGEDIESWNSQEEAAGIKVTSFLLEYGDRVSIDPDTGKVTATDQSRAVWNADKGKYVKDDSQKISYEQGLTEYLRRSVTDEQGNVYTVADLINGNLEDSSMSAELYNQLWDLAYMGYSGFSEKTALATGAAYYDENGKVVIQDNYEKRIRAIEGYENLDLEGASIKTEKGIFSIIDLFKDIGVTFDKDQLQKMIKIDNYDTKTIAGAQSYYDALTKISSDAQNVDIETLPEELRMWYASHMDEEGKIKLQYLDEWNTKLQQVLSDAKTNIQAVQQAFAFKGIDLGTDKIISNFDELKECLSSVQSTYESLQSAWDDYLENGKVNIMDYLDIITANPLAISLFTIEDGEIKMSKDWKEKLENLYKAILANTAAQLNGSFSSYGITTNSNGDVVISDPETFLSGVGSVGGKSSSEVFEDVKTPSTSIKYDYNGDGVANETDVELLRSNGDEGSALAADELSSLLDRGYASTSYQETSGRKGFTIVANSTGTQADVNLDGRRMITFDYDANGDGAITMKDADVLKQESSKQAKAGFPDKAEAYGIAAAFVRSAIGYLVSDATIGEGGTLTPGHVFSYNHDGESPMGYTYYTAPLQDASYEVPASVESVLKENNGVLELNENGEIVPTKELQEKMEGTPEWETIQATIEAFNKIMGSMGDLDFSEALGDNLSDKAIVKQKIELLNKDEQERLAYQAEKQPGQTSFDLMSQNYYEERRALLLQRRANEEYIMNNNTEKDQAYWDAKKNIQSIDEELSKIDQERTQDKIDFLNAGGIENELLTKEYETILATARTEKERMSYQKQLNEQKSKELSFDKEILSNQKSLLESSLKYFKGDPTSGFTQKIYGALQQNAADTLEKDKELLNQNWTTYYDSAYQAYINENYSEEVAQQKAAEYANEKTLPDMKTVMDDFEQQGQIINEYQSNIFAQVQEDLQDLMDTKPKEWAAKWNEANTSIVQSGKDRIQSYYSQIKAGYDEEVEAAQNALENSSQMTDEQINEWWSKWKDAIKSKRDAEIEELEAVKSYQDEQYEALRYQVDDYKSKLEDQKNLIGEMYDEEINKLQDKKDSIERTNKLIEYQNQLLNAQNEKQRVYVEGVGWTYQQDRNAIKSANKQLDDFYLQDQIDDLNNSKEAEQNILQDRIDNWDNFLKALEAAYKEQERIEKEALASEVLGVVGADALFSAFIGMRDDYAFYLDQGTESGISKQTLERSYDLGDLADFFGDIKATQEELTNKETEDQTLLSSAKKDELLSSNDEAIVQAFSGNSEALKYALSFISGTLTGTQTVTNNNEAETQYIVNGNIILEDINDPEKFWEDVWNATQQKAQIDTTK